MKGLRWQLVNSLNRVPALLAFKEPQFHCDRLPVPFHLPPSPSTRPSCSGDLDARKEVAAPLLAPSAAPPYLCRAPIAGRLGRGSPAAGVRHTASAGPT